MSINDFVEITIFLCLICFSISAKKQGFEDEDEFFFFLRQKFQNGHQKWKENDFWENSPLDSADTLPLKNFVKITLSHTVSKINAFLRFTQKFKMAAKNGSKAIFCEMSPVHSADTRWVKNFVKIAVCHTI